VRMLTGFFHFRLAGCATVTLAWILMAGSGQAEVVINEVMANVRGPESVYGAFNEFVELYNRSPDSVDLGGWSISDGDAVDYLVMWSDSLGELGPDVVLDTYLLACGGYCVILDREYASAPDSQGYMPYEFGPGTVVLTTENSTIGNGLSTTDPLLLIDSQGDTIDTYGTPREAYDSLPCDPGDGISMERIFPSEPDAKANWSGSAAGSGSTPGSQNSVTPYTGIGLSWEDIGFAPSEPEPDSPVEIRARVHNRSPDPGSRISVLFYVVKEGEGETLAEVVVEEIPSASEEEALALWERVPAGCHKVGVQVLDTVCAFRMIRAGDAPGHLVINEVMYDPEAGGEWVEIYNRSSHTANLRGWIFGDETRACGLSDCDLELASDSYILVCSDTLALRSAFPVDGSRLVEPDGFPSLNNEGDSFFLRDVSGFSSDAVSYEPASGGGSGVSLERVNPALPSAERTNWGSCTSPFGGTPGLANSIYLPALPARTRMSLVPNPFSPDGDGFDDRTSISYSLPFGVVRLSIIVYDRAGRIVRKLLSGSHAAGSGTVLWDGRDERGELLPVGVYLVYLEALDPVTFGTMTAREVVVLARKL
jgi:hypothetical protein